jgi:hypothetical protein
MWGGHTSSLSFLFFFLRWRDKKERWRGGGWRVEGWRVEGLFSLLYSGEKKIDHLFHFISITSGNKTIKNT